jgi:hypothetical protein
MSEMASYQTVDISFVKSVDIEGEIVEITVEVVLGPH